MDGDRLLTLSGLDALSEAERGRELARLQLASEFTPLTGYAWRNARQAVVGANVRRRHLTIQNQSSTLDLVVGFGAAVKYNGVAFRIPPLSTWEPTAVPRNAIFLTADSTTRDAGALYVVLEG